MADEKKTIDEEIKKDELTDEQTNEAAGGGYYRDFTCAYCGKSFEGARSFSFGGKACCAVCFGQKQQHIEQPQRKP